MEKKAPIISIITVVYNAAELLELTIRSVIHQTYPHIEYIIVDGNSSDGTLEVIKKYEAKIAKWISEPDQGLYDAMNKGIQLTSGDFVWFVNAGDRIFEPNTLERIAKFYDKDTSILYGEVMLVDEARKHLGTRSELTTQKLSQNLNWNSLKLGMVVCHQGILVARKIAPFYQMGNLAADIDWVIESLKKADKVTFCENIFAEYLQGGLSKQRHWQSLKDRFVILQKHYGFWENVWNHFLIMIRGGVFKIFK